MQNSIATLTPSVFDIFLGKLVQKLKIVRTQTNSSMQSSMMMFTFPVFGQKHIFCGKVDQKSQNCQFKLKFSTYNDGRNFLRPLDALPIFLFTTSETKRDYQQQTWYIRVAEPSKTQYLRKLGKTRKTSEHHRIITQCPVYPLEEKPRRHQQITAEKQKLKFSRRLLFSLSKIFCQCLCLETDFSFLFVLGHFKLAFFLTNLITMRPLTQLHPQIRGTKLQESVKFCPN